MDDTLFAKTLLELLDKQCGRTLPWPPKTLHDQVQYLAYAGRFLCPEYHFKWPQLAWPYSKAITDLCKVYPQEWTGFNLDRRHNLLQMLRLIQDVPGDTAECGVFEGVSSFLIHRYAPPHDAPRIHHMFDSFQGLSAPGDDDDGQHFTKYALACAEGQVRENLARALQGDLSHVRFYKGWIPSRFAEVSDTVFALVHIDVDLYAPTRDSIAFFYPRISPGGIIICDDYGFTTCPGATKAIDAYLADKPEKMLLFASGGGFLIKGQATVQT